MKKLVMFVLSTHIFVSLTFCSINSLFDVGMSARSSGLGMAFCAVSDDVSYIFYNPAGGTKLSKISFIATYDTTDLDIKKYILGLSYKTAFFDIGVGVVQRVIAGIEKTNLTSVLGEFSYSDSIFIVTINKKLLKIMSIGARFKFISQSIDTYKANGFGLDVGVLSLLNYFPIDIGIYLSNIVSSPIRGSSYWDTSQTVEENLPFMLRAGLKANLKILSPSIDFEISPSDSNVLRFYFGVEKKINKTFTIRGGIKKQDLENNYSILEGVSLGGSLEINSFNLDYAFVNSEALGFNHSLSLRLKI